MRVVVLDRESGETFSEDIGDDNPVAIYVPGTLRARLRGADRLPVPLPRHRGVRRGAPDEHGILLGRRARPAPVEHESADPLGARPRRVLITGAGGQLGAALAEAFPRRDRADAWRLGRHASSAADLEADLVLHAAAWTDVDGAEDDPQGAAAVNVGGTTHVAAAGRSARLLLDGLRLRRRRSASRTSNRTARSRSRRTGARSSRRGRAGEQAWIVRSSGLFGWTSQNFVRTMLRLGAERDEVSVVADQRTAPTYVGHLGAAIHPLLELPFGVYHVAADGECTWAEFAEAIFEEAGLNCRVRKIGSADWGARAQRPAYSVLGARSPVRRTCRTGGSA